MHWTAIQIKNLTRTLKPCAIACCIAALALAANGEGLASYQRYYLASSSFAAAHPDVIGTVFAQLTSAGEWVRLRPNQPRGEAL